MKANDTLTSAVLWLLGISSVVAGIILGIKDHISASATLLAGGILLLLFANLGKLESFKGLGIEAKTRDLTKRIEEAAKILGSLRDFLQTTATFTLQSMARQGRWDSHIPPREAYPIVKSSRPGPGVVVDKVLADADSFVLQNTNKGDRTLTQTVLINRKTGAITALKEFSGERVLRQTSYSGTCNKITRSTNKF